MCDRIVVCVCACKPIMIMSAAFFSAQLKRNAELVICISNVRSVARGGAYCMEPKDNVMFKDDVL